MKLDVRKRGQVFTPYNIVSDMVSLIKNDGAVLEPSCGEGVFLDKLSSNTTAIEIQAGLCPQQHLNIDFFDFAPKHQFDTIIGNPPYVKHKDIEPQTKDKLAYSLFDKRTNLYLFFIDKCIDLLNKGGELIFITPRDFLKQTSAIKLNEKLFSLGSFTYFRDFGDAPVFKNYSPNCAIWRWQKGLKTNKLENGKVINCFKGQIVFTASKNQKSLGDVVEIKVGAVSGADSIFKQQASNKATDFVCSHTYKTGRLRKMLYNRYDKGLLDFKGVLINRKIRKFNETNWWEWGRKYLHRSGQRIYVNCKTRNNKPFFVSDIPAYDGSMLALFPKTNVNINNLCKKLNDLDWYKLGFQCGGRYMFSQRRLVSLPINKL